MKIHKPAPPPQIETASQCTNTCSEEPKPKHYTAQGVLNLNRDGVFECLNHPGTHILSVKGTAPKAVLLTHDGNNALLQPARMETWEECVLVEVHPKVIFDLEYPE